MMHGSSNSPSDFAYRTVRPLRAVIKRWGPRWLKKIVWDADSRRGVNLHGVNQTYRSTICELVEKHVRGGHVLDLGCSDGHVSLGLDEARFASYTGVDISEVAIEEGLRKRAAMTAERRRKVAFHVGDIGSFTPPQPISVILFKDSLYYLPKHPLLNALAHYQQFLVPDGVFIVQMDDIARHGWIRELVRKSFDVIKDVESIEKDYMTFVFKSRASSASASSGAARVGR